MGLMPPTPPNHESDWRHACPPPEEIKTARRLNHIAVQVWRVDRAQIKKYLFGQTAEFVSEE